MAVDKSNENPKNTGPALKNSVKKLKEKFVPGVRYTLVIAAAFNFAMLIVGCLNVHKCPVNKNIPLFLIATGAIGLMSKFITYVRGRLTRHIKLLYFETSLYSVESVFFFLGSYWVYKVYAPSYDHGHTEYCNKTAYLFAFIYLTFFYSILLLLVFGCCCGMCIVLCMAAGDASSEDKANTDAEKAKPADVEATEILKEKVKTENREEEKEEKTKPADVEVTEILTEKVKTEKKKEEKGEKEEKKEIEEEEVGKP